MVPICFGPPQKEINSIKIVTSCITMSLCLLFLRRPSHSRKQRKEGSHLNPSPLRRPFRSTRTFRDEWLISEANLASNKQSLLFSGEGDISSCYPLVISLSAKKKNLYIQNFLMPVNRSFYGRRCHNWCFVVGEKKRKHTHTHTQRERETRRLKGAWFIFHVKKTDASCCREHADHMIATHSTLPAIRHQVWELPLVLLGSLMNRTL